MKEIRQKEYKKYCFNDSIDDMMTNLEKDNDFRYSKEGGTYYAVIKTRKSESKIQACSKARLVAKILEHLDIEHNN